MTKYIENGQITRASDELAGGHRYESTYTNGALSQKLIYSNGQRYVGQVQVGRTYQPHSTGTMFFPNGTRYEGEWKDGYPLPNRGTSYAADGVPIKTPKDTSQEQFLSMLLGGAVILGALGLLLGGDSSSGASGHPPANQGPGFENDWRQGQKCKVYAGTSTCVPGSDPGSLDGSRE